MGKTRAASSALPPTERIHPRADDLDLLSVEAVVRRLHQEDLTALRAVRAALPAVSAAARAVADALRAGGRLLYVGAGTSGRLGAVDASECPPTFGSPSSQVQVALAGGRRALLRAVEGAEDDAEAGGRAVRAFRASPSDVVCGISASASTPYVLGALAEARRRGARTLLVCCNPPSPTLRVDQVVVALTGPELVAGSTRLKAGTATKLILNALTTAAFVSLGRVYRGRMVGVRPSNAKLRARAARMVAELSGLPAPEAQHLLDAAGGEVRVAMAMHFTGLGARAARKQLEARGLRALEPSRASAPKRRAPRAKPRAH
ncbi:N-acetylmuramic acid 6-phosphate etherase [Corallococcus sp. H22C18031201]|uniref:N-acetylmuramic acid 6-phosphate etherase n=1 Tax=Citreicoccus inhibens TaxID=2849499 RepID=UPI000E76A074|nr:N-acetylmuramic acid 6-phosphate etherase [Citreicoccus inhibens]MBU8898202.1 N-acetylmuramic acid 6-phosphate etherase [Citreicoccus inhibens]RJS26938.1 N-acetylmuramic acid 6-phosphate etherase [Corallococcus sp. H22C18031201]